MVKIIRISIAGIQSTGKSFFIGGIKSAFMGNNIMDNMQYDILNNLKNNYFESILEIEHDIEDSYVKNNGTLNQKKMFINHMQYKIFFI